jgi:hypothetical protein
MSKKKSKKKSARNLLRSQKVPDTFSDGQESSCREIQQQTHVANRVA